MFDKLCYKVQQYRFHRKSNVAVPSVTWIVLLCYKELKNVSSLTDYLVRAVGKQLLKPEYPSRTQNL